MSAAVNAPISANDASGIGLFKGQMEPFYAMVKQAYIDAAKVAGILPREMQSITWEAQRVGLNDKNRQENTKKNAFDYIAETRLNEQTPYERATILISRNRSKNPGWGEQRGIVTQRENNEILSEVKRRANERISALDAIRGRSKRGLGDADTAMGREPSKGRASARKVESQLPLPEKGMGQGVSRPRKVKRMKIMTPLGSIPKLVETLDVLITPATKERVQYGVSEEKRFIIKNLSENFDEAVKKET